MTSDVKEQKRRTVKANDLIRMKEVQYLHDFSSGVNSEFHLKVRTPKKLMVFN